MLSMRAILSVISGLISLVCLGIILLSPRHHVQVLEAEAGRALETALPRSVRAGGYSITTETMAVDFLDRTGIVFLTSLAISGNGLNGRVMVQGLAEPAVTEAGAIILVPQAIETTETALDLTDDNILRSDAAIAGTSPIATSLDGLSAAKAETGGDRLRRRFRDMIAAEIRPALTAAFETVALPSQIDVPLDHASAYDVDRTVIGDRSLTLELIPEHRTLSFLGFCTLLLFAIALSTDILRRLSDRSGRS